VVLHSKVGETRRTFKQKGIYMKRLLPIVALCFAAFAPAQAQSIETDVEQEVAEVERAFAQSMADRDFAAFSSFLDEDAVFVSGPEPLRGKAAVMAAWKPLFDGEAAPFSWQPETVIALPAGDIALSTGPVMAPDGTVSVYYNSTWRKNEKGQWKIIFDKGQEVCPKGSGEEKPSAQ
jgi:ketosteroid isomerase-like protein